MILKNGSEVARVGAALLVALSVTACGGGGGGGSSPPPPPPPVVSPPPPPPPVTLTAAATAPVTSIQEGQPGLLDASGSTDTAGGTLTFAWTQTDGPTAAIDNAAIAKPTITVPEITADTPATFKVTVTSGSQTASATVSITFANIAQTPVFTTLPLAGKATFNLPVQAILGSPVVGLVGVGANSDPITFAELSLSAGGDLQVAPQDPFGQSFKPKTRFEISRAYQGATPNEPQMFAYREEDNLFTGFKRSAAGIFSKIIDTPAPAPCAATYPPYIYNSKAPIYVGGRKSGFSRYYVADPKGSAPSASFIGSMTTGQSFCAILAPGFPLDDPGHALSPTPSYPDVIAIDVDANTINRFVQKGTNATTGDADPYMLSETIPINLNATGQLKLVASSPVGSIGTTPTALALVYTDGVHNGEHRLVIVGINKTGHIVQDTYSWPLGVPTAVIPDDLNGDLRGEVVIISSTSPQAIVFEIDQALGPMLPLHGPSYAEIGLGATAAVSSGAGVLGQLDLYVAYRDKKEVRAFARH